MRVFNPLDKENLGKSVAEALLSSPAQPLSDLQPFSGAGIYAIYYIGKLAKYAPISGVPVPIYVGKAIPSGSRKGGLAVVSQTGYPLFKRLQEHGESIKKTNLLIDEFLCKYLIVDDIWIPLGESLLIARFSPIWNTLIDGFGNHDPGSGRYKGLRPRWDVLHPGRPWAERCQPRDESAEQIESDIEQYFRNRGLI